MEGFIDLPSGGTAWTLDVERAEAKMAERLKEKGNMTEMTDHEIAALIRKRQEADKVREAIRTIVDVLNGSNRKDVGEAILQAVTTTHRTLQQDFWSAILYAQCAYAAALFDARNEEAVKMANAVKTLAVANNWDMGLPRI